MEGKPASITLLELGRSIAMVMELSSGTESTMRFYEQQTTVTTPSRGRDGRKSDGIT
jgi:hypothetical protein